MIKVFLTVLLIMAMVVDSMVAFTMAVNIVNGNVNNALNLIGPATVLTVTGFIIAVVHDWLFSKK